MLPLLHWSRVAQQSLGSAEIFEYLCMRQNRRPQSNVGVRLLPLVCLSCGDREERHERRGHGRRTKHLD
jgi:hypothetical protein